MNDALADQLQAIAKTQFFKFYKLHLYEECPFWQEDGSCANRACGVETAEDGEIPEMWRSEALGAVKTASPSSLTSSSQCQLKDQDFCLVDNELDGDGVYVNLLENPERFTGYAGSSAARVWQSIYQENCFNVAGKLDPSHHFDVLAPAPNSRNQLQMLLNNLPSDKDTGDDEVCLEKRVFYRLISGLHASISIHICDEYLDQTTGKWAPNLDCFVTRIGSHPERLQNVYFNYVLMVRALSKAARYLENYSYCTYDSAENQQIKQLIKELIDTSRSCPQTFDEKTMFSSPEAASLKQEFKEHFRNVSKIMDCVGCDKCRLWGKLQVSGLGTALKILFSYEDDEILDPAKDPGLLQRTEIVALINTLNRFSESLKAVEKFRQLYQAKKKVEEAEKLKKLQMLEAEATMAAAAAKVKHPQAVPGVSHRKSSDDGGARAPEPIRVTTSARPAVIKNATSSSIIHLATGVAQRITECCKWAVDVVVDSVLGHRGKARDEL